MKISGPCVGETWSRNISDIRAIGRICSVDELTAKYQK